jgi:hypothetical protein
MPYQVSQLLGGLRSGDSIFSQVLPEPLCQTFWHLLPALGHLSCLQSRPDAWEIPGTELGGVGVGAGSRGRPLCAGGRGGDVFISGSEWFQ